MFNAKVDFEDYLMGEYFRIENPLDDESVEGFEDWIEGLGSDDLIDWANKYAKKVVMMYECKWEVK